MEDVKADSTQVAPLQSLGSSLLRGALGFGAASLCVFATVAFAERWMYDHLGLWGAYLAWTAGFIGLGGAALRPVAHGLSAPRFWGIWAASFFAYAVGWVGAYFALRGVEGEAAGAFVGSLLMAAVFAVGFGSLRTMHGPFLMLFFYNTVGYFAGSALNNAIGGKAGMLTWGVIYGLCLGAGLGLILHFLQAARGTRTSHAATPSSPTTPASQPNTGA